MLSPIFSMLLAASLHLPANPAPAAVLLPPDPLAILSRGEATGLASPDHPAFTVRTYRFGCGMSVAVIRSYPHGLPTDWWARLREDFDASAEATAAVIVARRAGLPGDATLVVPEDEGWGAGGGEGGKGRGTGGLTHADRRRDP